MARLLALLLLLSGCAPRLIDPIQFQPYERYPVHDLRELVGTEPAPLLAGEPAPFDGWLLAEADWQRLKDELRERGDRLEDAYGQVDDDRAYCSQVDAAEDEALRVCREGHWRAFGTGVVAGFGACGVGVFALTREP